MGASKDINFGNRDLSSSLAQSSSDQCHHKTCYNTTTFLISSASRLQRLPEATRNSVLTCLRSQFSARTPSMSSRKSARISAASLEAKENAVPEQTTKNVNASRKRNNPATEAAPSSKELSSGPSTPKRKRAAIPAPPPVTPTPSAIGLIAAPVPFGDMAPHAVNRLALPNGTNATLVTPETHRVVANKPLDQVSPSKVSKVKSTSGNILDEGVAHLIKVEPKLKPVIEKHPCHMFSPEGLAEEIDPFMFACFGLKRMDVFSTGDLGVQRGMAVLAGKNVSKLKASKAGKWKYMGEKEMEEMAEKFRPYRSLLMYYSWRVEDVDI